LTINSAANGSEIRKQTIAAQIRAKHLGMTHTASYASSIAHSHSQESVETSTTAASATIHPETNECNSVPVVLPRQSLITRPEDNYEISDKEDSDDDDSDSDSSEGSKRKKRIPEWAQRDKLVAALECQFSHQDGHYVDPDELFGEVESCDLRDIFGSPKKSNKYDRRASTGNWAKDRVTAAEKLAYKREHRNRVLKQQQCQ
jgi:Inner centromere protein, ARK binding region